MVAHIHTLFDTPAKARISAEDYIASRQSAKKSDLIEGGLFMAFPSSRTHEVLLACVFSDRLRHAGDVFFGGAPDLAVQIISPKSRQVDSVEKLINYGRSGVREYRLVDPIERSVTPYPL